MNVAEAFQENRRRPIYWPILTLFGVRKFGPRGSLSFFTHKNFLRKWPKTFKISIFLTYFWNKRSLKIRSKTKILLSHLLGQYWSAYSRQILEWSDENCEGAYWIWKKVDGRRTARHRISSACYVRSGAEKGLKLLKHIHLYEHSFSW